MDRPSRREASALVVDDDVHVRSLLAELLEEQGYDVITASNGFSGLRLAAERQPRLVLLDLMLPELSGVDVLSELRSAPGTRDTAVVVVTGNPQSLSEVQRSEIDGLVSKPFDLTDLIAVTQVAVLRASTRHAEVPPIVAPLHPPIVRTRAAPATRGARGRR